VRGKGREVNKDTTGKYRFIGMRKESFRKRRLTIREKMVREKETWKRREGGLSESNRIRIFHYPQEKRRGNFGGDGNLKLKQAGKKGGKERLTEESVADWIVDCQTGKRGEGSSLLLLLAQREAPANKRSINTIILITRKKTRRKMDKYTRYGNDRNLWRGKGRHQSLSPC